MTLLPDWIRNDSEGTWEVTASKNTVVICQIETGVLAVTGIGSSAVR